MSDGRKNNGGVRPGSGRPTKVKEENVLFIKDYGCVTRCAQLGMLEIRSDLFFLTVDDCIFAEDAIDLAMKKYEEECGYTILLVCPVLIIHGD